MTFFTRLLCMNSEASKNKTKIIFNPPPRVLKELLKKSSKIFLHSFTGPVWKDEKDLLFLDIQIKSFLMGFQDSNGFLTVFIIENLKNDKDKETKNQFSI